MTRDLAHVPVALLHALKHYKVLHERVALMQVETADVPHVPDEQRLDIDELGKGFYTIRIRLGFMDEANVLRALAQCRVGGLRFKSPRKRNALTRRNVRVTPRLARDESGIPLSTVLSSSPQKRVRHFSRHRGCGHWARAPRQDSRTASASISASALRSIYTPVTWHIGVFGKQ
jgi:K+ transporter